MTYITSYETWSSDDGSIVGVRSSQGKVKVSSSPVLDEIRGGRCIGYKGGRWVWHACVDCGRERWVMLKKSKPGSLRCLRCGTKRYAAAHPGVHAGVNHPMWGKRHSSESIEKMRQAHKGYRPTAEIKEKLRLANLGNKYALGRVQSAETRAKRSTSMLGLRHTPETITKMKLAHSARMPITDETREKLRISHTGYKHTLEQTQKIVVKTKGQKRSASVRKKISEVVKTTWSSYTEEEKVARLHPWRESLHLRPNGVEKVLLSLLVSLSSDWRYSGDNSLWVGTKNPDFWDGDHKLVELFGDFWHKGEDPQVKIDYFKRRGYSCLVIWESELADPVEVKSRVLEWSVSYGVHNG